MRINVNNFDANCTSSRQRPGRVPATSRSFPARTRQTTPPLRQPAKYLHGLARRLTKPFPYRYEGRLEGATQIFYSNLFRRLSGPSQPITFTDSPDDSRSSSLSDSQPITFTDSPDDPPSQTASPYRPCARIFRAFFCTAQHLQHFHFAPKVLPNCPGQVSARKVSKVNFLQSNQ